MNQISDALTIGRSFGIRMQLYYQDCGQLKKCWPDGQEQTLLSNTTQVFFGVNDNETAKYVSERLGESTIVVKSGGTNSGDSYQTSADGSHSSSRSTGTSDNWSQSARHLLKPSEVMALSERIAITFTPGVVAPIWTTLLRYYECDTAPPGWRQRLWAGVKMSTGSVLILVVAVMLALGASVFANEKAQERRMQTQQSFYR